MYHRVKTTMTIDQVLAELDLKIADVARKKHVEAESFGDRLRRLREGRGLRSASSLKQPRPPSG
jgi:hypothetical protein